MKKESSKLAFPHVMILLILLALFSCLLTYIVPAGIYQFDENGYVIADSFTYIENTPVSPVQAVIKLTASIASMGTTYALLFIVGGMVSVMISSGAVENLVDYSIFRLEDKSLKVLIPCISVLMSILGGLAGNDAMITFVAFYNTRYALRVARDPSKSIDGEILSLSEEELRNAKKPQR